MLPLALSNYFYGLTSVDLGSYIVASWIGMLPGTIAYVTAGKAVPLCQRWGVPDGLHGDVLGASTLL